MTRHEVSLSLESDSFEFRQTVAVARKKLRRSVGRRRGSRVFLSSSKGRLSTPTPATRPTAVRPARSFAGSVLSVLAAGWWTRRHVSQPDAPIETQHAFPTGRRPRFGGFFECGREKTAQVDFPSFVFFYTGTWDPTGSVKKMQSRLRVCEGVRGIYSYLVVYETRKKIDASQSCYC